MNLDFSLKLRSGFLLILCFAHLAGAISLKNGGSRGLVYLSINRLKLTRDVLNFDDLMP